MTVCPDQIVIQIRADETILEASRRYGISFRIGCREGGCGICKVKILAGEIKYKKTVSDSVISRIEQENGMCLLCRAIPTTDIEVNIASSVQMVRSPFSDILSKKQKKAL